MLWSGADAADEQETSNAPRPHLLVFSSDWLLGWDALFPWDNADLMRSLLWVDRDDASKSVAPAS